MCFDQNETNIMKKVLLSLSLLLMLAVGATAQSNFTSEPLNIQKSAEKAIVKWEAEKHDFGSIPQGTPVNHTFTFKNTGNTPFKIESVKPSCGCTAADYSKDEIAPGAEGYVKVQYNAKATGVFNKTITVRGNTEDAVKTLYIRGIVAQ